MAFFKKTPTPAPEYTGEARTQMHLKKICQYLDSIGYKYSVDGTAVNFAIANKGIIERFDITIIAEETRFVAVSVLPDLALPEYYPQVVEFITRANQTLTLGRIDFDYSDGSVRVVCAHSSVEGIPSQKDIEMIVFTPIFILDRFGDDLSTNMMGLGDPAKDIEEILEK